MATLGLTIRQSNLLEKPLTFEYATEFSQTDCGLVNVDDRTGKNALKDFRVQRVVMLCDIALGPIRIRIGKGEGTYVAEYSSECDCLFSPCYSLFF